MFSGLVSLIALLFINKLVFSIVFSMSKPNKEAVLVVSSSSSFLVMDD